jgi:hypothetical protein
MTLTQAQGEAVGVGEFPTVAATLDERQGAQPRGGDGNAEILAHAASPAPWRLTEGLLP